MRYRHLGAALIIGGLAAFAHLAPAEAQVPDQLEDAAEDEVADQFEALLRDAIRCPFNDLECIEQAKEEDEEVVLTDEDGEVITTEDGKPVTERSELPPEKREAAEGRAPGEVDANYDFEPGERTLFAEDFSSSNVGDFPRSLEFRGGSMEVVSGNGSRALRASSTGGFNVNLPETLPERFTLEFAFYTPEAVNDILVYPVDAEGEPAGSHAIKVDPYDGVGVIGSGDDAFSSLDDARDAVTGGLTPIRVMADGGHMKVFAGKKRVGNIPNADFGRTPTLHFDMNDVRGEPVYVADIRVAAGGKDLYNALTTEGRVAVQDILFETNSAEIQASSADVLKEIADMLKENPNLKLLVEGHTDDQGDFQHNMELSEKRAAAVKQYLVENHGIAADRLETMGVGPSQPVASNDTEEGRAENRRVELVQIEEDG